MNGEPLTDEELIPLFEAARWAPSSYNEQPWRFIYAKRATKHWETLFNLLVPLNQAWAKQASVLVLVISRKLFSHNGKPGRTHSYDTGAAWENLALEGFARGLAIHGMAGFDYDKARSTLQIPDVYEVEAMIAIGKRGSLDSLSAAMQKEEHPKERKPLKELIAEGIFSFS